jgi:zeaxanthin epoxidase
MMPNLGQGGCQAIEDAYVLTEELCQVTDKSQIESALQEYYRKRIVRSAIVQGMSRLSSDIIISSFSTPFLIKEFLKEGSNYKYLTLPSLLTSYLQYFLPFIFYAQFSYLYSFAPSDFDREKIKILVEASLKRNKEEVKQVYNNLKENYVTFFTAKNMSFMHFNKNTGEFSKIADAAEFRTLANYKI